VPSDPTLLGVAAIITALAGVITSIWGAVRSHREGKKEADEELRAHLRDCREESEQLASELHRIKMSRFDHES
jgi:uncharacterized protein YlxW (UPF0749 family)